MIDAYKKGIAECEEPIGRYINDNVMLTNAVLCFEDGDRAREIATRPTAATSTRWSAFTTTPSRSRPVRRCGRSRHPARPRDGGAAIDGGALLCGTPDEVCEQLQAYEQTGVDQVVFGVPNDLSHEEALECIELFGKKVIPEFDKDPEHRTTRYREHRPALARRALVGVENTQAVPQVIQHAGRGPDVDPHVQRRNVVGQGKEECETHQDRQDDACLLTPGLKRRAIEAQRDGADCQKNNTPWIRCL